MKYGPCTYCDEDRSQLMEREHVWPRSWPGPSYVDNIVWSCYRCNRAKGVNSPASWFFVLVERDGAVLGRDETLADRRLARLWEYWAGDIIELQRRVASMLPIEVAS